LKDLIEYIARRLVDNPDEVVVREVAGESTFLYELRTGDGDLGKIIGKHGQTIRAIRTILSGVAAKEHKRVTLEIVE
jgi:hypothetical protein